MIIYEGPRDYEFTVIPHAKRLVEALDTLGIKVKEFSIRGRLLTVNGYLVLYLTGELMIERAGIVFKTLPQILSSLIEDMREKIGKDLKPLGMFVYIRPTDIKVTYVEEDDNVGSLIIDCPEEFNEEFKRFGKGILIGFKDKEINIETLVISAYIVRKTLKVRITIVPKREIDEESAENIVRKKFRYLERAIKDYQVSLEKVEIITPKIKPMLGFVLIRKRSIEREADEIVQDEEIKSVLAKIRGLNENHHR
ncbi:hypothetical protein [Pyrococcus kukulkanii]|uniref:RNA-binding protein n=1 Tax=Pyrococcus kukulkanii TaxID=1609559 RepID=A0ABV4T0P8_9EURY